MSEMGQGVSAEIKVTPMQSSDYIADIEAAIRVIEASGLYFQVGPMSTVVSGPLEDVQALISEMYRVLAAQCKFAIDVRLTNGCSL